KGHLMPRFWLAMGLVLAAPPFARAATVLDLGTAGRAANWQASAGGGSAASFQMNWGGISITSSGNAGGAFLAGGSLGAFDGMWSASEAFTVPQGATNLSLSFSGFNADDRALLELNGTVIGNETLFGTVGPGQMVTTPGGPLENFAFNNTIAATINSGFVIGGSNLLTLVVNNTDLGVGMGAITPISTVDGTNATLVATMSYDAPIAVTAADTPVPEPASFLLFGGALGSFALVRRRAPVRAG
ncbi:MAG: PEP-CTERM sorting domain-containing protein, partial [Rhodospirillales bacterium]|nr:PEP-CTERM sorting domain-containing protein [Rhodospirillales bacterium]